MEDLVKMGKGSMDIPLTTGDTLKRQSVQVLLSRHYGAELEFYTNIKNPFVTVKNTPNLVFPKPKLSEYLKKMEKGEIKLDVSPFDATIKISNLCKGDTVEELVIIKYI